ncbi:alpha-xenorhabdolysin family binary toxin subunit A [Pseudomonas sp. dw_358]|uniref:alpha-xenorhabdolysin family binary toxin subunit A n=1 Tax=Pseudomonas sp. dw_358 TaxID=2720083 RepID=UPI001BD295BB|nr:alpha-xenorhabdolysin family binary toxin subunit A [Pseudomonas sp. dw_358]
MSNQDQPQSIPSERYRVRQPSIVFTADNLQTIKRYVEAYSRLPLDEETILASFSTTQKVLGEPLLKAIKHLNLALEDHVKTWPDLEESCSLLGIRLETFSKGFVATGEDVLRRVKDTVAYRRGGATLEELESLPVDLQPHDDLVESDQVAVLSLGEFLDYMKQQILGYLEHVQKTYQQALAFRTTLQYELAALHEDVMDALKAHGIGEQVRELEDAIAHVSTRIGEQQKNVDYYLSARWYGAVFGPLGLGISYLAVDSHAQHAEDTMNQLIVERDNYCRRLAQQNGIKGRFVSYGVALEDMNIRFGITLEASKHLLKVWRDIYASIENSQKDAAAINNTTSLMLFTLRFDNTMAPWRDVHTQSRELNELFRSYTAKGME